MNKKQKKVLIRIIVAAVLMIALSVIPVVPSKGVIRFVLFMIPYLVIGYDILRKAFKGILNRQVFDENFLMAVATVGAILLGDYVEGTAVMLFYQIGELFQSYAVGKSRRNISELMDIRPDYANIEVDGEITQVDPDEVEIGTVIVVQPGEKVPIDGVVEQGKASLNTSALTGESKPREVQEGDEVISGCINMTGLLHIRTTKEFGESTVSKILDLVENSSSKKSRSENFITKFAKYYTPAVCYGALALAVLPPLVRMFAMGLDPSFGDWIYRALTFLVISCPCALVISIPLSFFAGLGGASHEGVLVKGSNYLETLAGVKCVVFDKTGTMTQGVFEVIGVHHSKLEEQKLLEYAAHAECHSTHPISKSLCKAYQGKIDQSRVTDVEEIGGNGIIAVVDGKKIAVGNSKLMRKIGVACQECHKVGTVVHVAIDGEYSGHILIADVLKPNAKKAIEALHRAGIAHTVMLTGDDSRVAAQIAEELRISEVHSELLPGDKVTQLEALLDKQPAKSKLAFVGDGINDAPVLSRADIGIAMGALGSDAAIEAADVVLMDDDPLKISKAIRIARKCIRIVYENIYFAIGIKLLCLLLGAIGIANMWFAIFADVGVMVLAVLNAIRALFVKKL
ncbi:cadmium-translocating P-type ATPase [Clostridium sp. OM05-6BH]|jgi:Cd2+/Zn2+-exporting ATPase|uniref:heavy metal translocating P-type ATPase n=1 Tax=unclassified Clostridium TaxID=2614128 RepID=UPI000E521ED5|nr:MULTISPECIES: heavy metal translocating P-type ATPase [unclassified Clostridium]RHV15651.1 cadmium-translocating P-type ATPase [Clostridium sp. OM05-9BH]RHV19047.1 cadmium-translocating P-type ATPase [Clostridium sp. OM05-6BH]